MRKEAGGTLCLLLFACSNEPPSPPPHQEAAAAVPKEEPAPAAPVVPRQAQETNGGDDAGKIVQTYYALIGARKYDEAYALREAAPGAPSLADFAANFDRYADYHVTIGAPSRPVESGDWLYVEVPVQPYGRMRDGSPVSSAGMLTLRRRKEGGAWRIFTKG